MTFRILINRKTLQNIQGLREESQRIIIEKLNLLHEDPFPGSGGEKERLHVHDRDDTYRLHISHKYTAFYRIYVAEKEVHVLTVMSIEQAHKRYGWL